jgi:hypothetical protein
MPYYAVEESMIGPDNVTLIEPHQTAYVTFLATHVADLVAYFDARQSRANGSVSIDEDRPPLNWGTPNNSGMNNSWQDPNLNHSTPKPRPLSGVQSPHLSLFLLYRFTCSCFISSHATRHQPQG